MKKIDTKKVVLQALKDKKIEIEGRKNKIKIFYKNSHVTNLSQIILPSKIELDEKFIEGIGLYCGDGDVNSKCQKHITFSTVDEDIGKFEFNFFKNYFDFSPEKIKLQIYSSIQNKDVSLYKWSKILNLPTTKFKISVSEKNKQGCLQIHINSIIFGKFFRKLIKSLLKNILTDPKLRKAFLRGFFAADGSIETRKKIISKLVILVLLTTKQKKSG